MKFTKIATYLATSFSILAINGCSDNDSYAEPDLIYAPNPVIAVEFPVQTINPEVFSQIDSGSIFISTSGMSLYFFADDQNGSSSCNGVDGDTAGSTTDASSCAGRWPPLLANEGAVETANYTLITRDDGTYQWSFRGYPLYTFSGDSTQGEFNGDGVGGVWHLARPQPLKVTNINGTPTYVSNQIALSGTLIAETIEKFRIEKDGLSLYIFDDDTLGSSACSSEGCIATWPPLLADNGAKPDGLYSIIERSEGDQQWAYKGKPLYFFTSDTEAGQTNGDDASNVFHIATQLPAIMRTNNDSTKLSATGLVSALLPNTDNSDELEPTLVDKDQFTLYTFDNDESEVSNCIDSCAANWPPFLAQESEQNIGNFSIFERADGSMQWALNQQPLYFFSGDTQKTEANGEGIGDVWHTVTLASQVVTSIVAIDTVLGDTLTTNGTALVLIADENDVFIPSVQDKSEFQLYTFDNDEYEISNCNSSGCLENWPPLLASKKDTAAAPFSIFTRDDGYRQWAINGMPLYFFTPDTLADDQNGESVGEVWWIARPAPLRLQELISEDELVTGFIGHGEILPSQGKTSGELTNLTLYIFDNDEANSGVSTCLGNCANTWPPLYATIADQAFGEYEIIDRTENDGEQTLQWTYKGQPLYFVRSDSEIGDTNGVYGTWHIATP